MDRFRDDFDQFIVGDEFHRLLQREFDRRLQARRLVRAGGAQVRQLLPRDQIDHQVDVARVDSDEHAFVARRAIVKSDVW